MQLHIALIVDPLTRVCLETLALKAWVCVAQLHMIYCYSHLTCCRHPEARLDMYPDMHVFLSGLAKVAQVIIAWAVCATPGRVSQQIKRSRQTTAVYCIAAWLDSVHAAQAVLCLQQSFNSCIKLLLWHTWLLHLIREVH